MFIACRVILMCNVNDVYVHFPRLQVLDEGGDSLSDEVRVVGFYMQVRHLSEIWQKYALHVL